MAGRQATPLPVLTDIRAIRALSQAEAAREYPVRIRGTVTHFDELRSSGLFVFDGEYGQFVQPPATGSFRKWEPLRTGDIIEITGHTIRGGFAPNVQPGDIRIVGHTGWPTPMHVVYASLLTGR